MSEPNKWKRRERALSIGLVLWAIFVSAYVSLQPEYVATWIQTTSPWVLAGSIMMSAGFAAGFCDTALIAVNKWAEPSNSELTDVPWETEK